ncbi:MAG: hypothetical protein K8T91_14165 [Planctomycetes bacterium]|nr:hypothetical protein [Planctomycetota bacterium]
MMSSEYSIRPISEAERLLIREHAAQLRSTNYFFQPLIDSVGTGLVLGALLFIPLIFVGIYIVVPQFPAFLKLYFCASVLLSLVSVLIVTARRLKDYRERQRDDRRIADDFLRESDKQVMEILMLTSNEIVQVDEPNNGLGIYFYKLDATKCVLLRESDYGLDPIEGLTRVMPNDSIEIVRLPESKTIVRLVIHGQRIDPQMLLDAHVDQHRVTSGDILALNWGDVVRGDVRV